MATIDDDAPVCYLCLDGDESDEQLQRDCACRGSDAGFVHLSCLVEFAASKSLRWDGGNEDMFVNPWRICLSCHQEYQNEVAVEIATEFVSFVLAKYPDDTRKQVEAPLFHAREIDTCAKERV